MKNFLVAIFLSLTSFLALSEEMARLEFWAYHSALTHDNYTNQAQLRYYQPFNWFWGWKGMSQLNTATGEVKGPAFKNENASQWEPGNTRWTMTTTTPDFLPNLNSTFGVKSFIPIAKPDPAYNASQWELGPQVDLGWTPENLGSIQKIRPLVRYMVGFRDKTNLWHDARNLELYPTVIVKLPANFSFSFYETNSIIMSTNDGKWLIPLDGMLSYKFNKNFTARIGGTVPIVDEKHKSVWMGYSSLAISF